MEDKRFNHVLSDPKFRKIPKTARKVKIDDRFKGMFTDKQFKVNYTVDKRGRPVNKTSTEDLKRYYHLSSDESGSELEEENEKSLVTKVEGDKKVSDKVRKKLKNLKVDYARGEANLCSDSSSDDSGGESNESDSEDDVDHKWGELDADAERTEEATSRLAACNMDWDRIRASDLMVLFNSFIPSGGMIKSVEIFPSEFGLQRMKEEEVKGPIELVETKAESGDDETEEGSKFHMEKLRQYQLNRLKYYYAVITCDSANTANKIYTECDGMEYESTATKLDLRFIPEDMTFEHPPKEKCDDLPDLIKYKPRFFTTTALQQAKVDLTWDETDPDRIEITQKLSQNKLDEIDDEEISKFVAMSSENESEDEPIKNEDEQQENEEESSNKNKKEIKINKYRALLLDLQKEEEEEKENDIDVEVEWKPEMKEKAEELVKKKLSEKDDKTPFEKYLEKRKENRKEKRKKSKKGKNPDEEDSDFPSDIDMNDPYFAEEFNKDEFKKKQSKKKKGGEENEEDALKKKELELLLLDDEDVNEKKHFNYEKIVKDAENAKSKKKKKLSKKKREQMEEGNDNEAEFDMDLNDDRFQALFTSHSFNIDPTDPQFKKTKNMEKIIKEKLKRKNEEVEDEQPVDSAKRVKAELSALVKSVKNKTKAFKTKS